MRYLFVVPPLVGHINPLAGVSAELTRRGHETAWAGTPAVLDTLIVQDRPVYPVAGPDPRSATGDRPAHLRGFAALQFLWEDVFLPLADAGVPGVLAAIDDFRPDVVVADQQALAGPLAALRTGRPWVTSASTSAEFTNPLAATPKVAEWRRGLLDELVRRHAPGAAGPDGTVPDIYASPDLVLAFTSELLALPGGRADSDVPSSVHFVGPSTAGRRPAADFPWDALADDRPVVFVSLGTVSTADAHRFLRESVAAAGLTARPVQFVVADPGGCLADLPPRPDVIVRLRVPQLELLERVSAVVCHGGHNTVCEALAAGVPLVVAPIRDDQPVIAQQVTQAGAGVRLRFGRVTAQHVAGAIDTVLDDPAYREAAARVRRSFADAGGAGRAADLLEELARQRPLVPLG